MSLSSGNNNIGSLLRGANAHIMINGQVVAQASNVNWNVSSEEVNNFFVSHGTPHFPFQEPCMVEERIKTSVFGVYYSYACTAMKPKGSMQTFSMTDLNFPLFKPHERLLSLDCLDLHKLLFE